ncbi:hypothetical protein GSI_12140 [Ganoderma sinense ZZ0214-1]|uniref:Uncharacterized protein n=1 Tax=Ganoderma sinense ZZ0214-1 TaxID=1077348 RepID=A0A2G8RXZ0_9APHY|nr:hypothetical protein GSI_12140 [Ganoderma sinense ZZ0214-1]
MNSTCCSLDGSTSPSSDSGQDSSTSIDGQLNDMILNAFWLGALAPISIALILTSSHLWKKPVFILNACAIVCAIAFGGITVVNTKDVLAGRPTNMQRIQALIFLSYLVPICTQAILLVRILAVYPPRILTWKKNLLVYGVLAVVLTARIINMGVYLNQILSELRESTDAFVAWKSAFIRIDWFLELFYVMYTSILFLLKLGDGNRLTLRGRITTSVAYSNSQRSSYAERLRALFWIAVFNFVFPTVLNVVSIVLIFRSTDSFALTDLVITNLYVEIVFVLLATIWCSGKYWDDGQNVDHDKTLELKANAVESMDSATFATPSRSMLASHAGGSHSSVGFAAPGEKQ